MWSRLFRALEIIRRAVTALVALLLLAVFVVAVMSSRPSMPDRAVLLVQPKGELVEQLTAPQAAFPPSLPAPEQTRVRDLTRAIRAAKTDDRIRGLLLDLRDMAPAPLEKLRAIARAIADFRASGKPVHAVADVYTQSQYYLATRADTIWLHPMGMVMVTGMSLYRHYLKDALDRLHVRVHLFRAGEFKSAVEPLVRNAMSEAARRADAAIVGQLWQVWKQDVATHRKLDPDIIQRMLDDPATFLARHGNNPARLALDLKLVDQLATPAEARQRMAAMLKLGDGKELPTVDVRAYLHVLGPPPAPRGTKRVGLIVASGPVVDGEAGPGAIGGDSLAKLLDRARHDPAIQAVVLRIDSPGGSAVASETIRRAVLRLKAAGKPVVVSMGSMAASGGYWMAAPADEIWASPVTLTGSIGVFAVIPEFSGTLAALGVTTDGLATTRTAAGARLDRPLSPAVAQAVQAGVDHVYQQFIAHVAEGRRLPAEAVRKVAAGRVWTGRDALARKLVDHLGGLEEAIAAAARRAHLGQRYAVQRIQPRRTLRERILEAMMGKARAWVARAQSSPAGIPAWLARALTGGRIPPLLLRNGATPVVLAWSDVQAI